jgi:hypothetical protein
LVDWSIGQLVNQSTDGLVNQSPNHQLPNYPFTSILRAGTFCGFCHSRESGNPA